MAESDELSNVTTLGPCPTCGRERLQRVELEPLTGRFGVHQVIYIECGGCPTSRTTFEPAADDDAPVDPF